MADIAKRYASNPGSQNGVDGMVAGIPLAMAFDIVGFCVVSKVLL